MTQKEVLATYYELLGPFLKEEGFKPLKKDDAFIRKTEYGFDKIYIQIITYKFSNEHKVHYLFDTRHDDVQYIVDEPLKIMEEYRKTSTTTNVHIATLLDDKNINRNNYKYVVHEKEDIIKDVENFKQLYNSKIRKHYQDFSSIENILNVYKETPELADSYCGPHVWYYYYMTIAFLLKDKETLNEIIKERIAHTKSSIENNEEERRDKMLKISLQDLKDYSNSLLEKI